MSKQNNIVSTADLSIGYKTKAATVVIAENLNLNFQAAKLIALIGANGIGKSTLLRTITGIQKPLQGAVFLNDKKINSYEPLELAQNLSIVLTRKITAKQFNCFRISGFRSSTVHKLDRNLVKR